MRLLIDGNPCSHASRSSSQCGFLQAPSEVLNLPAVASHCMVGGGFLKCPFVAVLNIPVLGTPLWWQFQEEREGDYVARSNSWEDKRVRWVSG
jgi:hypothetical protein